MKVFPLSDWLLRLGQQYNEIATSDDRYNAEVVQNKIEAPRDVRNSKGP